MTIALGPEQVEALFDDGFIRVPDVFDEAELREMRAAFDRLRRTAEKLGASGLHAGAHFVVGRLGRDGKEERTVIHRVAWCGAAEPVLADYGRDPRLVSMAAALLGSPRMTQLINQAHFKMPGDGVAFPWHQDSSHRRYGTEWSDVNGRGSYVQTVTALDDVDAENGPLRFIPGTGRIGHLDLEPGKPLPASIDPARAVAPALTAGSVLLFGPYTVHMSEPNRSTRPRRAFLNGYAYPGAYRRIYPGAGAGRRLVAS